MSQQPASIRQLVSAVASDARHLLQAQSELAKAESAQTKKDAQTTGGMLAVAAVAGATGGLFLLLTLAWTLVALGLPTWAGFGIVTAVLLLTAGVTGAIGVRKAKGLNKFATTKAELSRTTRALSGRAPSTELQLQPSSLPSQRK